LFIKGLIYGLIVSFANFAVSYINLSSLIKKKSTILAYFLLFLLRFAVIGVLVYIFLKFRWGSVLGLMVGFTAALLIFTAWRVNSGNTGSNKL
jgi:hypothetical protein